MKDKDTQMLEEAYEQIREDFNPSLGLAQGKTQPQKMLTFDTLISPSHVKNFIREVKNIFPRALFSINKDSGEMGEEEDSGGLGTYIPLEDFKNYYSDYGINLKELEKVNDKWGIDIPKIGASWGIQMHKGIPYATTWAEYDIW